MIVMFNVKLEKNLQPSNDKNCSTLNSMINQIDFALKYVSDRNTKLVFFVHI